MFHILQCRIENICHIIIFLAIRISRILHKYPKFDRGHSKTWFGVSFFSANTWYGLLRNFLQFHIENSPYHYGINSCFIQIFKMAVNISHSNVTTGARNLENLRDMNYTTFRIMRYICYRDLRNAIPNLSNFILIFYNLFIQFYFSDVYVLWIKGIIWLHIDQHRSVLATQFCMPNTDLCWQHKRGGVFSPD